MFKVSFTALATTLTLGLSLSFSYAAGSSPVAWVSKQFGNDVSGCGPVTSPCKTFQFAHDQVVAPGGTINVRDAGGYGRLVIKNAISIINESGVVAGVFGASGDAIKIQAGATDDILIKGVILDGGGVGNNGINLTSARSLFVVNCTIRGFGAVGPNGNGIYVNSNTGTALTIVDTILSRGGNTGLWVAPQSAASVIATITRAQFNNNAFAGFYADSTGGSVTATIEDSVASLNGKGIYGFGSNTNVTLARVNASNNINSGLFAELGANLKFSASVATGNFVDVSNNGPGIVTSFSNNIYTSTFGSILTATLH
jgi:hypothetical protein